MAAITAREMVNSVGMSNHPNFYADRAPIRTDFNGSHLFGIYRRIRDELGTSAADAFVTMVENLKILSAFNFLNALYALEARGWVYEPVKETDMGVGPGDTENIKKAFLVRIGKIPSPNDGHTQSLCFSF